MSHNNEGEALEGICDSQYIFLLLDLVTKSGVIIKLAERLVVRLAMPSQMGSGRVGPAVLLNP